MTQDARVVSKRNWLEKVRGEGGGGEGDGGTSEAGSQTGSGRPPFPMNELGIR